MKTNSGAAPQPPQCLATIRTGKALTHHRCRLIGGHSGEHQCVVPGCYAGWRTGDKP